MADGPPTPPMEERPRASVLKGVVAAPTHLSGSKWLGTAGIRHPGQQLSTMDGEKEKGKGARDTLMTSQTSACCTAGQCNSCFIGPRDFEPGGGFKRFTETCLNYPFPFPIDIFVIESSCIPCRLVLSFREPAEARHLQSMPHGAPFLISIPH